MSTKKTAIELISDFKNGNYQTLLEDIYEGYQISYQTDRYIRAMETYIDSFGDQPVEIYSAPGRTEIGGNHTDHQHGAVLAASITLDAIAIVSPTADNLIKVKSNGYDLITISLSDLEKKESEKETTTAIIKGVLAGLKKDGFAIGGFQAYITSDVLIGAGLSSSAAFETLIGAIISGLYNNMKISPIQIAITGQYAENEYFGKPCGLMDQMASSVGSLVHIDFKNPIKPEIEKQELNLNRFGYTLCIVDTKGSHADLTDDYAAIPREMKAVASHFGKEVLREVSKEALLSDMTAVREKYGDRAVLRALHFFNEHERVKAEAAALKEENFSRFLDNVQKSGDSSFKYLQNVYSSHDLTHQNISLALAVSDDILNGNGAYRIHGGGFAGTILAFLPNDLVSHYTDVLDGIFGKGSCTILKIRKYGGIKVL